MSQDVKKQPVLVRESTEGIGVRYEIFCMIISIGHVAEIAMLGLNALNQSNRTLFFIC